MRLLFSSTFKVLLWALCPSGVMVTVIEIAFFFATSVLAEFVLWFVLFDDVQPTKSKAASKVIQLEMVFFNIESPKNMIE